MGPTIALGHFSVLVVGKKSNNTHYSKGNLGIKCFGGIDLKVKRKM
jgi:coenzyme F420-reducing hydrogenase delta subunit